MTILATLITVAGVLAIFYLIMALLSLKKRGLTPADLPGMADHDGTSLSSGEAAVAEAFWRRTEILLQNGRFDAALADCKQALAIDPDHREAKRLWDHLFPGETVSARNEGKTLLRAATMGRKESGVRS